VAILADQGKHNCATRGLGYEVVGKTSSFEALGLFRTHPDSFDLVITDMTIPNMTGSELAQQLMRCA
jgi:CheY-like chemotaxis protein